MLPLWAGAKAHIARVYEVQLWAVESVMNHDVAFDHRCPDLLSFRTSATCGISCVTSLRSACAASGGATSLRMLSGLGLQGIGKHRQLMGGFGSSVMQKGCSVLG